MQNMSVSNMVPRDTLNKLTDPEIKAMCVVESILTTNLLCHVSPRELHTFPLDYEKNVSVDG